MYSSKLKNLAIAVLSKAEISLVKKKKMDTTTSERIDDITTINKNEGEGLGIAKDTNNTNQKGGCCSCCSLLMVGGNRGYGNEDSSDDDDTASKQQQQQPQPAVPTTISKGPLQLVEAGGDEHVTHTTSTSTTSCSSNRNSSKRFAEIVGIADTTTSQQQQRQPQLPQQSMIGQPFQTEVAESIPTTAEPETAAAAAAPPPLPPANTLLLLSSPKPKSRRQRRRQRQQRNLSSSSGGPSSSSSQEQHHHHQIHRRRTRSLIEDYFMDLYNELGSDSDQPIISTLLISDNHPTHSLSCPSSFSDETGTPAFSSSAQSGGGGGDDDDERRCIIFNNEPIGLPPLDCCYRSLDTYCHTLLSSCGIEAKDTAIVSDDPSSQLDLNDSLQSLELGLLEELRDANVAARRASSSSSIPALEKGFSEEEEDNDSVSNHSLSVNEAFVVTSTTATTTSSGDEEEEEYDVPLFDDDDVANRQKMIEESYMSVDIDKQSLPLPPEQKTSPNSVMDLHPS